MIYTCGFLSAGCNGNQPFVQTGKLPLGVEIEILPGIRGIPTRHIAAKSTDAALKAFRTRKWNGKK